VSHIDYYYTITSTFIKTCIEFFRLRIFSITLKNFYSLRYR